MKAITFFLSTLAIGLLPATLGAQSTTSKNANNETVNYYAEFADLMHGELNAKLASATTTSGNTFPAFVHYRKVMMGKAEDFLSYYETMWTPSVPAAETVFANWAFDRITFTSQSVEDCSGR